MIFQKKNYKSLLKKATEINLQSSLFSTINKNDDLQKDWLSLHV